MLARLVTTTDPAPVPLGRDQPERAGPIGREIAAAGVPLHSLGVRRGAPTRAPVARLLRVLARCRPDISRPGFRMPTCWGSCAIVSAAGAAPRLEHPRDRDGARDGVRWVLARLSRVPDAVVVNVAAGSGYHEGPRIPPAALGPYPERVRHRRVPARSDDARIASARVLGLADDAVAILLAGALSPGQGPPQFPRRRRAAGGAPARGVVRLVGAGIAADNRALEAIAAGLGDRLLLLGERADLDTALPGLRHRHPVLRDRRGISQRAGRGDVLRHPLRRDRQRRLRPRSSATPADRAAARPRRARGGVGARSAALGIEGRARWAPPGAPASSPVRCPPSIVARYEALYEAIAVS